MTKNVKHATLSEVAKRAGVGITTVSRVINGGQSVDPKTLVRVQHAIDLLGYIPNQAARILKGAPTRTVGFVIPSIADPFFSSCAEAAQAVARANDSLLIVLTTQNESQTELDAVHVLMRHRVDGFIIAPCNSEAGVLSHLLRRVSMPVIALDRPIAGVNIPSVVVDNFAGAQLATRHLIEHGYKRIVCLTGEPHLYTIQERILGYRDTMIAAGLAPMLDSSIRDFQTAERALGRLMQEPSPPEALFTLKNSTTIDVFEALQTRAIAVPRTVAMLGYDDFQLAATLRPSISVIQQPINQLGHVAAELLFQILSSTDDEPVSDDLSPPQQVVLTTELIRRVSCGCSSANNVQAQRRRPVPR